MHLVVAGLRLNPPRMRSNLALSGGMISSEAIMLGLGKTDAEIQRIKEQRRIDPVMPIYAPISGTVVARKAGPGQYVQPSNTDPVYTIADLSKMWLVAQVSELDIPFVHLGDEVVVRVAAYPKEVFRARITNIGAVVDPTTRRITVRSEVESRGYQLKPQMFASFRIVTDAGTPTPAQAARRASGGDHETGGIASLTAMNGMGTAVSFFEGIHVAR